MPQPRRRRRIVPWLILILIAAGVLYWGYIPTQTGPASGSALEGTAIRATTRPTLRVATFNIHSGRNEKGEFNLDRTAAVMKKDFDIIGLNEVRNSAPFSQDPDQAEMLGGKLKMQSLFAATEQRWWRDDFGNGLLSAVSVADWKRTPLAGTAGRGKRNVLQLRLMLQGVAVNILITHIDRGADRASQMQLVGDQFLALPRPAILMGDLNSQQNTPEIERLLKSPDVKVAGTGGIDWIFTRGLETVAAGVIENDASDHPLVWAELKLPDTPAKKSK